MAHDRQQNSGRFITFEGGEGVGKSTQIKHLAATLQSQGISPVLTREPGGSPFAERAREILLDPGATPKGALAQSLLFFAARSDHLDETIRPALAAGRWVLCDRFTDSTRAYQGAASGVDPATIATLDHMVVGADQPHLTVLLDLDPKIGLARADQRRAATPGGFIAADTYEGQRLDFHQRLRQGFLEIAQQEPNRVVVVDAFRNELTIADEIWRIVSSRFVAIPRLPEADL
jgi:dTMP kinase